MDGRTSVEAGVSPPVAAFHTLALQKNPPYLFTGFSGRAGSDNLQLGQAPGRQISVA